MPDFSYEDLAQEEGFSLIAGLDEVGRGPWAGPVLTCAVIIDRETFPNDLARQLDDSKKLSAKKRVYLFEALSETVEYSFGEASVEEIDSLNILQATFLAMRRAIAGLTTRPDLVLVDGNRDP
ncbi:MAG: ribonuclease HII, partial [Alphaproteobacteria bacterium]|nr:ribonuclease HII [Alphaproteobacteria bacterium]